MLGGDDLCFPGVRGGRDGGDGGHASCRGQGADWTAGELFDLSGFFLISSILGLYAVCPESRWLKARGCSVLGGDDPCLPGVREGRGGDDGGHAALGLSSELELGRE